MNIIGEIILKSVKSQKIPNNSYKLGISFFSETIKILLPFGNGFLVPVINYVRLY